MTHKEKEVKDIIKNFITEVSEKFKEDFINWPILGIDPEEDILTK